MLPLVLLLAVPSPVAVLLLLLATYHLLPLLSLLPSFPLLSLLLRLTSSLSLSLPSRNLPREFFNLPPRSSAHSSDPAGETHAPSHSRNHSRSPFGSLFSDNTLSRWSTALGVRAKVMLLLLLQAALSLGAGWAFLVRPAERWGWAGLSMTSLPGTMALLALFTAVRDPTQPWVEKVTASGGLRHPTIFPRILPVSLGLNIIISAVCAAAPRAAPTILLGSLSCFTAVTVIASAWCAARRVLGRSTGAGRICLYSPLPSRSASAATTAAALAAGGMETEVLRAENGHGHWPTSAEAEKEFPQLREQKSWLSSPSTVDGRLVPDFSYSSADPDSPHPHPPVSQTAYDPHVHPSSRTSNGTPTSWVSSPTTSPTTIEAWDYSPSAASFSLAAHPSAPDSQDAEARHVKPANPISLANGQTRPDTTRTPARRDPKNSTQTISPDGSLGTPRFEHSIIASYSPDPFQPQPRGFESLSTFHPSQSELSLGKQQSLAPSGSSVPPVPPLPPFSLGGPSGARDAKGGLAFVPAQRISPTSNTARWTLVPESPPTAPLAITVGQSTSPHMVIAAASSPRTPHRPPPPPPLNAVRPVSLPPSPILGGLHSASTPTPNFGQWQMYGKESMEGLLSGEPEERDWVTVDVGVDGVTGWGRGSDGSAVGLLGVMWACVAYGLTVPVLILGSSTTTQLLFLLSLLLPAPLLALSTYMLSYTPAQICRPTRGRASQASSSDYRSLALQSESQLSLPAAVSPRLTPPAPSRSGSVAFALSRPAGGGGKESRLFRLLQSKPSVSNFGYPRPRARPLSQGHRRHTVLGYSGVSADPRETSEQKRVISRVDSGMDSGERARRTLSRRSADVWLAAGHAKENLNLLQRAGEMMRPVPALRVLERTMSRDPQRVSGEPSLLTRLRGGVVSLLMSSSFSFGGVQEAQAGHVEMQRLSREDLQAEAAALEWEENLPDSPIQINVTSPSRYHRTAADPGNADTSSRTATTARRSILSRLSIGYRGPADENIEGESRYCDADAEDDEEEGEDQGHDTVGEVEMRTAQRGRKSISPTTLMFPHLSLGQAVELAVADADSSFAPAEAAHSTPRGHQVTLTNMPRSDLHQGVRESWDELRFADADETRVSAYLSSGPAGAGRGNQRGIDLPPFPVGFVSTSQDSEVGDESTLMRHALSDIAPALSHYGTPRRLLHQPSAESRLRVEAVREVAPYLAHGTPRTFPPLQGEDHPHSPDAATHCPAEEEQGYLVVQAGTRDRLDSIRTINTIRTVDEEGAEEMERVLRMDTPTRAAFVISPISVVSNDNVEVEPDGVVTRCPDPLGPKPRTTSAASRPLSRISSSSRPRSASSRVDFSATALELQSIGQRLSAASLHSLFASRPLSGYDASRKSSPHAVNVSEGVDSEADESVYLTSPSAPPIPTLPSYAQPYQKKEDIGGRLTGGVAKSHPHPPPLAALPALPSAATMTIEPTGTAESELVVRSLGDHVEATQTPHKSGPRNPVKKHKYTISLDYIHTPSRPLASASAAAGGTASSSGPSSAFVHVSPSKARPFKPLQAASLGKEDVHHPLAVDHSQLKVKLPEAHPPIPVPIPAALPALPARAASSDNINGNVDREMDRARPTMTPHSAHSTHSASSGTTFASAWTEDSPATKVAERWAEFKLGRRELEKVQALRARSHASKEGLKGVSTVAESGTVTESSAVERGDGQEKKQEMRDPALKPLLLQGTPENRQTVAGAKSRSAANQGPALKPLRLAQRNERRRSSLLLEQQSPIAKLAAAGGGAVGDKGSRGSVISTSARSEAENSPAKAKKRSRASAVGTHGLAHSPRKKGSAGAGSMTSPKKTSKSPAGVGVVIRM